VHWVDSPQFAAAQHRLFVGMHLRIGRSDTVRRYWIKIGEPCA
jgi:hypothetical protein